MAVAVKSNPEVAPSSRLDRVAAVSLLGTVYLLGCLGIVFYLVPSLWWTAFNPGSWAAKIFLGLVMAAAGVALAFLGGRMLGPKAVPGVRAGIFYGLMAFLLVLLLTRWVSMWIEHWVYDQGMFGDNGPQIGAIITAVIGLALLFFFVRRFMRPRFESFLVRFEAQGWFSARAYKALQGARVRRGTIFGLLVLVGSGVYTMIAHGTLNRGPKDWSLNVPFSGKVTVTNEGDARGLLADGPVEMDRRAFQELEAKYDPVQYAKIYLVNDAPQFHINQIVSREELRNVTNELNRKGLLPPKAIDPVPPTGELHFARLTLLPSLPITLPLLILGVSLWLAWRIVNTPTFADFLIATDAELNKVSWTTQRRLVQDTIVVLVTVVLLASFLFVMDQTWRVILSWKPIGVLQIPEQSTTDAPFEDRPW